MIKTPLFFAATLGVMGLIGMAPAEARTHHHHTTKHVRMSSSCGPTAYSHSRTRVGVAQDEPDYYVTHRRSTRVYRERNESPRYGSVEYRRDRRAGVDVDVRSRTRTEGRSSARFDSKTKSMHSEKSMSQHSSDKAGASADRDTMKGGDKDRMGASDKGADRSRMGASDQKAAPGEKTEGRSSSDNKGSMGANKPAGAGASSSPSKAGGMSGSAGGAGSSATKPDQK